MIRSAYKTAVIVSLVEFCVAQEGLLGGLWPFVQPPGPLGAQFPFGHFGLFPFGGLGQSGEQGVPGGFGQYGSMPFGMVGPFGSSGQAGEQGGTEAATEPGEAPANRQPSLLDLNMMLLWNQLVNNQGLMPTYDSSNSAQEPGPIPPTADTKSMGTSPVNNANNALGQSLSTDMSWFPFLLLQQ